MNEGKDNFDWSIRITIPTNRERDTPVWFPDTEDGEESICLAVFIVEHDRERVSHPFKKR